MTCYFNLNNIYDSYSHNCDIYIKYIIYIYIYIYPILYVFVVMLLYNH